MMSTTVQGNNYFGTLYLGLDPVRPWRLSLYDWVMYESNYRQPWMHIFRTILQYYES